MKSPVLWERLSLVLLGGTLALFVTGSPYSWWMLSSEMLYEGVRSLKKDSDTAQPDDLDSNLVLGIVLIVFGIAYPLIEMFKVLNI